MAHKSHFSSKYVGVFDGLGGLDVKKPDGKRSSDLAHVHRSHHHTLGEDVITNRLRQSEYISKFKDPQWFEERKPSTRSISTIPIKCQVDALDRYVTQYKQNYANQSLSASSPIWGGSSLKDAMIYPKIHFEVPGHNVKYMSQTHSSFKNPDSYENSIVHEGPTFWEKRPHYNIVSNHLNIDAKSSTSTALPPKPQTFNRHGANWSNIHFVGRRDPILGIQDEKIRFVDVDPPSLN